MTNHARNKNSWQMAEQLNGYDIVLNRRLMWTGEIPYPKVQAGRTKKTEAPPKEPNRDREKEKNSPHYNSGRQ